MSKHLGLHIADTFIALALAEVSGRNATISWTAALPRTTNDKNEIRDAVRSLLRDCPAPTAPCTTAPPAHRVLAFALNLPPKAKRADVAQTVVLEGARLASDTPADAQLTAFTSTPSGWLGAVCDRNDLAPLRDLAAATNLADLSCDLPALAWQRILPALDNPDAILDLWAPSPILYLFPQNAAPHTITLPTSNIPTALWRAINDFRQRNILHVQRLAVFGSDENVASLRDHLSQYEGLHILPVVLPDQAPTAAFAAALATGPAGQRFDFLASPRTLTRRAVKSHLPNAAAVAGLALCYTLALAIRLHAIDADAAQTQARIDAITPQLLHTQTLMHAANALQQTDKSAQDVRARNTQLVLDVAELGAAIPSSAWLSSLNQTATGWAMTGHATNLRDEALALDNLQRMHTGLTPSMVTASGSQTSAYAWSASLDSDMAPPPAAPPTTPATNPAATPGAQP